MRKKNSFFLFIFFLCQLRFMITCQAQSGSINMETWTNIYGTSVSSIPVYSTPNSIQTIIQFEAIPNSGDNYGRRIRGYIYPPITGNYTFWIASDNTSELWLSTTNLPQNKEKIAWVPGWTMQREWSKYPSQKSVTKYLIADQKYYIEALHKEIILGDNLSVGWQLPDGTMERPIPGARLSPFTNIPVSSTFAIIADYGSNSAMEAAVANLVKSWQPQFIITAGDNNYPTGAWGTIDVNIGKFYHDYIKPYTGVFGSGAAVNSFFPTLGNHDVKTSNGAPYLQYFTLPGNERYYDFIKGNVHFFAINSNPSEPNGISDTSPQAIWLKNKLAASDSKWNIVYFHHSPFCSDKVHGSQAWMQWPFKAWGADVVISGNAHVYERIIRDNFPYFVNGLGGQSIYGFKAIPVAGSQVRYNQNYGALNVTVTPNTLKFRFYSIANRLIDSYTLVKQGLPIKEREVNPIPVITVTGPTVLNKEEKTMLHTLFDSAAVYQWKLNDVLIAGENTNTLVVIKPGLYKVKVFKNRSIAISESIFIGKYPDQDIDTTAIVTDEPSKADETYVLKVFPNPNNGIFTITLNMAIQPGSKINVIVVDGLGHTVYNNEFVSVKEYLEENIELDKSLAQGVYHLQIIIGNKVEKTNVMLLR